jgi:hypothetical protein
MSGVGSPDPDSAGQSATGSGPSTPPPGPSGAISDRTRNVIALTITAVWALGIVADILIEKFALSPWVYATMFSLSGAAFGANFVRSIR